MEQFKRHVVNAIPLGVVVAVFAAIVIPMISNLRAEDMKKIQTNKEHIIELEKNCANNKTNVEVIKSDIRYIKEDMQEIKESAKENEKLIRQVLRAIQNGHNR
jgi:5-bromo-4-chloroindolyl phosphate hydrolysis protein